MRSFSDTFPAKYDPKHGMIFAIAFQLPKQTKREWKWKERVSFWRMIIMLNY